MADKNKKAEKKSKKMIFFLIILFLIFVSAVMFINSKKPDRLVLSGIDKKVNGSAFIKTNLALVEQMYGNWMPNDLFWPTVLLDNMPNFQIGELEVVRYNIRVLRDNLTRMRTTDKLDPLAEEAFTSLSNDPFKWWFPSAEGKWKQAHNALETFDAKLLSGASNFYSRADNLIELLSQYASLMGGANTRLINAPGDIDRSLVVEENTKKAAGAPKTVDIDIPWYRVDNNFYYAQGVAYGLYESFKAIKTDFLDVLKDKNSVTLVDKILENLRRCHFEPLLVCNGDPDSIFANHSLNLSGVFNDARQKVNSLIVSLTRG